MVQHPRSFEFNERLLVALADCYHEGRYGTFLFDCQRERQEAGVGSACASIWWHVARNAQHFTNLSFVAQIAPLLADFTDRSLQFWRSFYFRYDERTKQLDPMVSAVGLHERLVSIQNKLARLRGAEPNNLRLKPYASSNTFLSIPATPPVSSPGLTRQVSSPALPSVSSAAAKPVPPRQQQHLSLKIIDELLTEVDSLVEQTSNSADVDETTQESPPSSPRQRDSISPDISRNSKKELKANRPVWEPDTVKACHTCATKIGKGTRHHCRACGHIFCDPCCNKKFPIERMGYFKAVRVCEGCALRLRHEVSRRHLQEILTFKKRATMADNT